MTSMPAGKRNTKFNITIGIRAPKEMVEAIDLAAQQRLMTPTEYIRGAIFDRLVADGMISLERGAQNDKD